MNRTIKEAFIVWCITVGVFVVLIFISATTPDLESFPVRQLLFGGLVLLDVLIGVISFLIAMFLALVEFFRNSVYTKNPLRWVFVIVLVGAVFLVGYLFINDRLFVKPETVREKIASQLIAKPQPIVSETKPEEPKHGYQAGPIVNIKNESYFVSGNDREILCEQIDDSERRLKDNRIRLGYISYNMRYSYFPILTGDGYTIGDFTVMTDSTITVPQWTSSEGASDDTKNDWRRFKNEVRDHENKHQEILVENASEFVMTLNNLGYYQSESALNSAIESLYNAAYKKLMEKQDNFDENYENEPFQHFCENH